MARIELQIGPSYVGSGAVGAASTTPSGGSVATPDAPSLGITGDLDVRVDITALDWTPALYAVLAAKWLSAGNQRSWALFLYPDGKIDISWSTAGTSGSVLSAVSTAGVGAAAGTRRAVRATLDVNNGLGGRTVTFYTAATLAGPWTQLGAAVTAAGTTSIFDSTAEVSVGGLAGGIAEFTSTSTFVGKIHGLHLHAGIGGTRVASPDFTDLAPGQETLADHEGNEWVISGSSVARREWVDVTADGPVYERAPIGVSGGRSGEGGSPEPSKLSFELANRDGVFSPRNPSSPYYGIIGRNTPVRVSVDGGDAALLLRRAVDDYAFTRDSSGISVTGDIDIRVDYSLTSWEGQHSILLAKYFAGGQHSFAFGVDADGVLFLLWSADGSNDLSALSTVPLSLPHHGRKALRATLDVNNGLGGRTATFYIADTLAGPWTQLGAAVTAIGTTSIFDSTAELRISGYSSDYTGTAHAVVYGAELRSGIGGSVVASPDFTSAADAVASFLDAQGNEWTVAGAAEITSRDFRFTGEVGDLPVTWGVDDVDVYIPVDAAGIRRRLGQGASPLRSTLRRGLTALAAAVAYWPCEDGDDATSVASGLPGGPPMAVAGEPDFGAFSDFKCSAALPLMKGGSLTGAVPEYDDAGEFQCWFLLAVPAAGVAAEAAVVNLWTGNATAMAWQLRVTAAGALRLLAYSPTLATLVDTGAVAFEVNAKLLRVSIGLQQNGADVDYLVHTLEVGEATGLFTTGTLSTADLGTCFRVEVNHEGGLDDVCVGHISVHNEVINLFDLSSELNAHSGESAAARIRRLCGEEGVDAAIVGGITDTTALGYQLPRTLLELLDEAADADGGILHEPRGWLGLAYRTRASMYAQDALAGPALELDYTAGHLSAFRPTEDDRLTRNDITVTRAGGASARRALESGPLSVAAPPGGVGRYDDAPTLSLAGDDQAAGQASWRLHLGTVDEPRYPEIAVDLARGVFTADPALSANARALGPGDLVTVTGVPGWMPPDDVAALVQGYSETIRHREHRITWHAAPASPWAAGLYEDDSSRYSSRGSVLAAAATSSATSISVRTPAGPLWGHGDGDFDIYIGGERMTVTAVSGASSPQSFTVTRSVNGVVKAHPEGTEARLFRPVYYAL